MLSVINLLIYHIMCNTNCKVRTLELESFSVAFHLH